MHNGQQKPKLRRKRRGVKWMGRPAGSSGSWGDDERYHHWYRYGVTYPYLKTVHLRLWLLKNSNRKPHSGSRTYWSAWPSSAPHMTIFSATFTSRHDRCELIIFISIRWVAAPSRTPPWHAKRVLLPLG